MPAASAQFSSFMPCFAAARWSMTHCCLSAGRPLNAASQPASSPYHCGANMQKLPKSMQNAAAALAPPMPPVPPVPPIPPAPPMLDELPAVPVDVEAPPALPVLVVDAVPALVEVVAPPLVLSSLQLVSANPTNMHMPK